MLPIFVATGSESVTVAVTGVLTGIQTKSSSCEVSSQADIEFGLNQRLGASVQPRTLDRCQRCPLSFLPFSGPGIKTATQPLSASDKEPPLSVLRVSGYSIGLGGGGGGDLEEGGCSKNTSPSHFLCLFEPRLLSSSGRMKISCCTSLRLLPLPP